MDSENQEARQQYEILQCFTVSQSGAAPQEGDGTPQPGAELGGGYHIKLLPELVVLQRGGGGGGGWGLGCF